VLARSRLALVCAACLGAATLALAWHARRSTSIGALARPTDRHVELSDPFPLDGRTRLFDTREGRLEGVIGFERVATGRERLSDQGYTVFETRVVTKSTGARRVVSKEWLTRTPAGIFCGRRQEGSVVCDLEPAQPVALLPLSVGRRWTWAGRAGGRSSRMECTVAPREQVTLRGGTIPDAWRIDQELRSEDGPPSEIRRTLWLQPGVGLIAEKATIAADGRRLALDAVLREVSD
jgi:hypothetical protein